MTKRRTYTAAFKAKVVLELLRAEKPLAHYCRSQKGQPWSAGNRGSMPRPLVLLVPIMLLVIGATAAGAATNIAGTIAASQDWTIYLGLPL